MPLSPRYLAIGRIVGAFGVHGEVKVEVHTDYPERFHQMARVYLGEGDNLQPVALQEVRPHQGRFLLRLEGCPDRTAAEGLRGQWLYIPIEEAMPLDEDEYYEYEVLGLRVETVTEEFLGHIQEVIFTGANEVFVVQGDRGELLIPVLEDVVLEIDRAGERVLVALPPGLRQGS
ncbi:MAG: 16S rRNA processing protein RimM [Chloroflexi bacterium]|nr:16S rRNA processing protein RimM [Chloroflexota bacterium]